MVDGGPGIDECRVDPVDVVRDCEDVSVAGGVTTAAVGGSDAEQARRRWAEFHAGQVGSS